MTKSLFLSLALIAFSFSASYSQVTAGFKVGVSLGDLNGLEFTTDGSSTAEGLTNSIEGGRTGYFAGFLLDIPLTEKLSFVPEFMYSQQGKDKEAFRVDYLTMPLGLKFDIKKFYIGAGPQIAVKVWTPEQSNVFTNFEASVFGNIGYIFESNIFIEARYTLGVTDVFQDNNNFTFNTGSNPTFRNLEGTNATIHLGIGYRM